MELTFWGTRGSVAVPGPETLRYGGNTTCLEVRLASGELVVIDAGTGIRKLGDRLLARGPAPVVNLLVTHLHWDHLIGAPFFAPFYRKETLVRVGGWPRGLGGLALLFNTRHSDGHFPVAFEDLPSRIEAAEEMMRPRFALGGAEITLCPLNHPQGAVGFGIAEAGRRLVFLTDNELAAAGGPPPEVVDFCRGAAVLIHDGQYLPEEMDRRRGWGHSDWAAVLRLARAAGVERLILTHHDPARRDEEVDRLLAAAREAAGAGLTVEAAWEGLALSL